MRGIDPRLQLSAVGILETAKPEFGQSMSDRALGAAREECAVPHLHGAFATDDLAAHLVAVGGVDEGLDLHEYAAARGEEHEDRVEFAVGCAGPGPSGHDLDGGVVVVQQPAVDVDLVDRGVGQRARGRQPVRREGIAMRVVDDQRLPDRCHRLLECDVAGIESPHEAQ